MLLQLLLLLSLCILSQADSWFYPNNYTKIVNFETWHLGETKELRWDSTLPQYNIVLQQNGISSPATGYVVVLRKETANGAFTGMNWTVQKYNFNLDLARPFYFIIADKANNEIGRVRSNNFNISSTPGATTGNITSLCPTYSATDAPLEGVSASSDQKVKTTELGLGIALGVPLLLSLCSIAFLMNRLRATRRALVDECKHGLITVAKEGNPPFSYHEISSEAEIHEFPNLRKVYEAPDTSTATQCR